jgi:anti-sigma factor RsiW
MSETDALLVAYVDGELDAEAIREVERLIAEDPRARQAVEIYRETAGLLRAACSEHAYAADSERLMPAAPCVLRRAPRRYGWVVGAALAACAVGFVGGARFAGWPSSEASEFASEVAEYHAVFAGEDRHLVELGTDRTDEFTSWLGNRLGRRLTVPDLAAEGLKYVGGRMLVVNGRPVAQMMYTRPRGRPVALCITKLDGSAAPIQQSVIGKERTALWQDGTYGYVVVGELDEPEMRSIAADAARQTRT